MRVRNILQHHFPHTKWNISLPDNGQHRASYIAQSEEQQVFIKFDVPVGAIQRLSEIQVAPRIVANGLYEGSPYVVQEYITGRYPDWRWFASHRPYLAEFIRCYHSDKMVPVHPDPNTKNMLLVDRIYWWAARASFSIALWHVEHEFDCTDFLRDFIAALNKSNNPRAVFQ